MMCCHSANSTGCQRFFRGPGMPLVDASLSACRSCQQIYYRPLRHELTRVRMRTVGSRDVMSLHVPLGSVIRTRMVLEHVVSLAWRACHLSLMVMGMVSARVRRNIRVPARTGPAERCQCNHPLRRSLKL